MHVFSVINALLQVNALFAQIDCLFGLVFNVTSSQIGHFEKKNKKTGRKFYLHDTE